MLGALVACQPNDGGSRIYVEQNPDDGERENTEQEPDIVEMQSIVLPVLPVEEARWWLNTDLFMSFKSDFLSEAGALEVEPIQREIRLATGESLSDTFALTYPWLDDTSRNPLMSICGHPIEGQVRSVDVNAVAENFSTVYEDTGVTLHDLTPGQGQIEVEMVFVPSFQTEEDPDWLRCIADDIPVLEMVEEIHLRYTFSVSVDEIAGAKFGIPEKCTQDPVVRVLHGEHVMVYHATPLNQDGEEFRPFNAIDGRAVEVVFTASEDNGLRIEEPSGEEELGFQHLYIADDARGTIAVQAQTGERTDLEIVSFSQLDQPEIYWVEWNGYNAPRWVELETTEEGYQTQRNTAAPIVMDLSQDGSLVCAPIRNEWFQIANLSEETCKLLEIHRRSPPHHERGGTALPVQIEAEMPLGRWDLEVHSIVGRPEGSTWESLVAIEFTEE